MSAILEIKDLQLVYGAGSQPTLHGVDLEIAKEAKRILTKQGLEFILGALRENPHRVGKPLREPLSPLYAARRGEYRVVYRIIEYRLVIEVVSVVHRRDAYGHR